MIATNALVTYDNLTTMLVPVVGVKTYLVAPPYLLIAGTVYTFKIDFTTNDNLYQVGAYYEVNLKFT